MDNSKNKSLIKKYSLGKAISKGIVKSKLNKCKGAIRRSKTDK